MSAQTESPAAVVIGAAHRYSTGEWFREMSVDGVTFLAPLDDQERARQILARRAEPSREALATPAGEPGAAVDEAMVARAEAYMLSVLPGKSTACLGGRFNFYDLLTATIAGKAAVSAATANLFMAAFNCEAEGTTGTRLYANEQTNVLNALAAALGGEKPAVEADNGDKG